MFFAYFLFSVITVFLITLDTFIDFFSSLSFKTIFHYVAQTDFLLMILLPQAPTHRDYRQVISNTTHRLQCVFLFYYVNMYF